MKKKPVPLIIAKAAAGVFVATIEKDKTAIMAHSKASATSAAIKWAGTKRQFYVKGNGACAETCSVNGVPCRVRAPGAGRKASPASEKRVNLVVRVRPDVKAGFTARALANDTSAGEEVDKAHDATAKV
jgi:hypothetical protein